MSRIQITCGACGKVFLEYPRQDYKTRFCDRACKFAGQIGTTISAKTRQKLVNSHLGNKSALGKHWKVSAQGRANMSEGQKRLVVLGIHRFWKGGVRKVSNERNDPAYILWAQNVKRRDGRTCRLQDKHCSGRLEAHHIYRWADYPDKRYDINNGIALCQGHHPRRREDEQRLIPVLSRLVGSNLLTL
jgi:hypothetical protein